MQKKVIKRNKIIKKKKRDIRITIAILIIATLVIFNLGLFILKKPSITGFAVKTIENTYNENPNLIINESKNITWDVKNPGDLKSIKLSGSISRNATAKVYIKKDNKSILLFDSSRQLFDIDVKVLQEYKKVFQGDELLIQIILFNLKGFGAINVNVKYSISTTRGKIIATEMENVTVETQARFVRKLLLPSDLNPGTYFATVEVESKGTVIGKSSDSFEIVAKFERPAPPQIKYLAVSIVAGFVLIVIAIYSMHTYRKLKKKKEIVKFKKESALLKIEKLEQELKALEEAYNKGFISEETYNKEKKRLEERLGVEKE